MFRYKNIGDNLDTAVALCNGLSEYRIYFFVHLYNFTDEFKNYIKEYCNKRNMIVNIDFNKIEINFSNKSKLIILVFRKEYTLGQRANFCLYDDLIGTKDVWEIIKPISIGFVKPVYMKDMGE